MAYLDQIEADYDDDDPISCVITTVIWGQNIEYSVDKHTHREKTEHIICVAINDSYDARDLGQGFEGQALDSLKRGVAVGVTRWILSIPLSDGVYHIFMCNDDLHSNGFAKIAKRLGFQRVWGTKSDFTAVIKDGQACRWRTTWAIIKSGLDNAIQINQYRLERAYHKKIYQMRQKYESNNKCD